VEKYTCPCCGYKTLDDEHEYEICPICYWEDDYLNLKTITVKVVLTISFQSPTVIIPSKVIYSPEIFVSGLY